MREIGCRSDGGESLSLGAQVMIAMSAGVITERKARELARADFEKRNALASFFPRSPQGDFGEADC